MGLHHATLGSAVKKYGPLKPTMSEASLRAEIAKDEKEFDTAGIDEIIAALPGDFGTDADNSADTTPSSVDSAIDTNSDQASIGIQNVESNVPNEKPAKVKKPKAHVVISEFRDKDDFAKRYNVGDDVSHFDEHRKADLVDRKLIEATY